MADVLVLVAGVALVVASAELLFEGLLALAARLEVPAFTLTALVSGLEVETLAAGIAANARGLGGAAAGTFLGGTTFLALGVAGLGAGTAAARLAAAGAAPVDRGRPPPARRAGRGR